MEDSPRGSKGKAEKDYKNTQLQHQEDGTSYCQEAMIFKEHLMPINGGKLKEIHHRSLVAITFLNKDGELKAGTGVLISKDTVLTAAQNIYDRENSCEYTDFKIYIGKDGVATTDSYEQVEEMAWRYPEEFKKCEQNKKLPFDYAIMKLKQPIDFQIYMPLCPISQEGLLNDRKEMKLSIFGFPSDYPPSNQNYRPILPDDKQGKKFILNQYGLALQNRITVVDSSQSKIGYGISTLPGQSGSPVVIDNTIIAVHVGGEINKEFNVGRIIDQILINNITEWGKDIKAAPFSLEEEIMCQHNKKKDLNLKGQKEVRTMKQLSKMEQDKIVPVLDMKKQASVKTQQKQVPIKTNPATKLQLSKHKLKSVDLWGYANLVVLNLSYNELKQIDLAHCPSLTTLNLSYNQLQQIYTSKNTNLTHLNLSYNQLQTMDVSANTNLTWLYLPSNQLQTMDVSANTNLTYLGLHNNKLQKIDVSANTNLTILWLYSNKLTEIDTTNNTKLQTLYLQDNRLSLIRLWIAEHTVKEEELYPEDKQNAFYHINFSNQESPACQVQFKCDLKQQAVRQKAEQIATVWRKQYSQKDFNQYKCAYSFVVQ